MSPSDWKKLEDDVVERIRMLAAIEGKLVDPDLKPIILRDLVEPHAELLKHFVSCVKVGE